MPGLCCFDGNFRGFAIADLANHHDIRILPQQRSQHALKGEPRSDANLGLIETIQRDLNGILDAAYIHITVITTLQGAIERDRFSASRRPGNQNQPLRLVQCRLELHQCFWRHP